VLPADPDLAAIIDAWDRPPMAIHQGVVAMVKHAGAQPALVADHAFLAGGYPRGCGTWWRTITPFSTARNGWMN
jgi:hypothetical protein